MGEGKGAGGGEVGVEGDGFIVMGFRAERSGGG